MILLTDPDPEIRTAIQAALNGSGPVTEVDGVEETIDLLEQGGVDALILGPGHGDRALRVAERIERSGLPTGSVLVTSEPGPELFRRAMRSGVRDVVEFPPDPHELEGAVHRVIDVRTPEERAVGAASTDRARITTVFSTKGGIGKSVVASNLALLLREETGEDVAVLDLDLQSGDLAVMLQMTPSFSIHDAAAEADRLDEEALRGYLAEHRSGIDLLPAPADPSLAETISDDAVQTILRQLQASHDHVVIDGPASFGDQILAALDLTDHLILVAGLDVPSVKNLKLALKTLRELGWGPDDIQVVLNRAQRRIGLQVKDVRQHLEADIDVVVPATKDVPRSINEGRPLAETDPRSDVVGAIAGLLPGMGIERRDPGLLDRIVRSNR